MKTKLPALSTACLLLMTHTSHPASAALATFGEDAEFLKKHTEIVVLSDSSGQAKVAVAPAWQGRVMTSSARGDAGASFGFLNRDFIRSAKLQPHINVFGGEDRFWIGPEGGQFSVFFAPGAPFDLEHWYTPAPIDTLPYKVARKSANAVSFTTSFSLTNYSGTKFEVQVDREVRLLNPSAAWQHLGVAPIPGADLIAFESDNRITNTGRQPWIKSTGLLSIWILGMFNPSPTAVIAIPVVPGPEKVLGPEVTSDYFGRVPAERLRVKADALFFSADGKYRSKIGLNPRRSRGVLGSYDATNHILTIVQFTQPGETDYVNSLWKIQDKPFGGDAANAYNDGPPSPGAKPLGPFFELESSSPAAALDPGKSLTHVHRTFHLVGAESALDPIARTALGLSIQQIKEGLN